MHIRTQLLGLVLGSFVCATGWLGASAAEAATYYVAKTGSDSRSCAQATSASTPKLTINGTSGGLRCMKAGDTLVIAGGTYAEVFNPGQIPSGTSSAPVTLKAASGQSVVIRPTAGGKGGDVLWLTSSSSYTQQHITFDGLTLDGTYVSAQVARVSGAAHHIRFLNGTLRNAPQNNCTNVQDGTTRYITYSNMTIHDCGNSNQHHGIYVRGANVLIEKSRIYNHSGHGVHIFSKPSEADNNVVRNNEIYQNGSWGILAGSGQNNLVYNNIVRQNGKAGGVGGIRIGYYSPLNTQVYNNTVYGNANYCVMINEESAKSIVRNNICWQNAKNYVADFASSSVLSNTLTTDPQFVNPASNDLRVRSTSPAINKGMALSQVKMDYANVGRPQGGTYDIGAYEYVSSAALTSPLNLRLVSAQ